MSWGTRYNSPKKIKYRIYIYIAFIWKFSSLQKSCKMSIENIYIPFASQVTQLVTCCCICLTPLFLTLRIILFLFFPLNHWRAFVDTTALHLQCASPKNGSIVLHNYHSQET